MDLDKALAILVVGVLVVAPLCLRRFQSLGNAYPNASTHRRSDSNGGPFGSHGLSGDYESSGQNAADGCSGDGGFGGGACGDSGGGDCGGSDGGSGE